MVPFRLTQNLVDGCGVCGIEGAFRRTAEVTLGVLRQHRPTLVRSPQQHTGTRCMLADSIAVIAGQQRRCFAAFAIAVTDAHKEGPCLGIDMNLSEKQSAILRSL